MIRSRSRWATSRTRTPGQAFGLAIWAPAERTRQPLAAPCLRSTWHPATSRCRRQRYRGPAGLIRSFRAYGLEDTELGLRLAELGYRLFFNAAARATTVESKTVNEALQEMQRLGQENLPRVRRLHPGGTAPFWIDRFESSRLRDRMLRFLMNPVTDAVVGALLPVSPFWLQRRLLNYQVLRAVWRGYGEAMGRPAV